MPDTGRPALGDIHRPRGINSRHFANDLRDDLALPVRTPVLNLAALALMQSISHLVQ
jgi:hypothetical protein